jgi:hypothetical protein
VSGLLGAIGDLEGDQEGVAFNLRAFDSDVTDAEALFAGIVDLDVTDEPLGDGEDVVIEIDDVRVGGVWEVGLIATRGDPSDPIDGRRRVVQSVPAAPDCARAFHGHTAS